MFSIEANHFLDQIVSLKSWKKYVPLGDHRFMLPHNPIFAAELEKLWFFAALDEFEPS